eukprot:TRINITY_DN1124_c0_g2_i1.p1 TRINITY_DN1124_c0_g2~~TRINITY_DN1124_c0_g2_i1.p1  ORF type:complete len:462 (+),score=99.63 TRINITY_DN1124_c0_g2_i1:75-1460(+)
MVKLNISVFRYLEPSDFRILTAIEMGMKNHEIVPTQLINTLAKLRYGGTLKAIQTVHKHKLVFHDRTKYDGYKLTYSGYDFLALKAMMLRGSVSALGKKLGVGKESDIYMAVDPQNKEFVIKFHRLGRTSFRTIKRNRDYLKHRKHASWLYLSRLAALKEYAMMKVLYDKGFPVPMPIDLNRHCVAMQIVEGYPLENVRELAHPDKVYNKLIQLLIEFANHGLIHGDFNEFNIMINDKEKITVIDFPQMISTDHPNAKMYFDRDVECIRTFFHRRFGFEKGEAPVFGVDTNPITNLEKEIEAFGFNKQLDQEMEQLIKEQEMDEEMENELKEEEESDAPPGSASKSETKEDRDLHSDNPNLNLEVKTSEISEKGEDENENKDEDKDIDKDMDSDAGSCLDETLSNMSREESERYQGVLRHQKIIKKLKKQTAQRDRRTMKIKTAFKMKEKQKVKSEAKDFW